MYNACHARGLLAGQHLMPVCRRNLVSIGPFRRVGEDDVHAAPPQDVVFWLWEGDFGWFSRLE